MNDSQLTRGFVLAIAGGLLIRLIWHHSQFRNNEQRKPGDRWALRIPAKPGEAGTLQTLTWMAYLVRRDAADLKIREAANSIVRDCQGHDARCEIEALFRFVRDEITFRRDPIDCERVQDAERTLDFKAGDCDDKTVLLCTLLAAVGHKSILSVLGNKPGHYSHVFAHLVTPQGLLALDPTNEAATVGWRGAARFMKHFKIFR